MNINVTVNPDSAEGEVVSIRLVPLSVVEYLQWKRTPSCTTTTR